MLLLLFNSECEGTTSHRLGPSKTSGHSTATPRNNKKWNSSSNHIGLNIILVVSIVGGFLVLACSYFLYYIRKAHHEGQNHRSLGVDLHIEDKFKVCEELHHTMREGRHKKKQKVDSALSQDSADTATSEKDAHWTCDKCHNMFPHAQLLRRCSVCDVDCCDRCYKLRRRPSIAHIATSNLGRGYEAVPEWKKEPKGLKNSKVVPTASDALDEEAGRHNTDPERNRKDVKKATPQPSPQAKPHLPPRNGLEMAKF